MYYFVGNNIGHKTAGIEKAMINRLNLFKAYHYQAKNLITSMESLFNSNSIAIY